MPVLVQTGNDNPTLTHPEATNFQVRDGGHLYVLNEQGQVAVYAPGAWKAAKISE